MNMFADNTVVFLKRQTKVNELIRLLNEFKIAIEIKVNWIKSLFLTFESEAVNVRDAKKIKVEKWYIHLKISINITNENYLNNFWKEMMIRAHQTVNKWFKCHLLLKNKVLLINTLIMSILRYTIQFMEMSLKIRYEMNEQYYRMIWNNKKRSRNNLHSDLNKKERHSMHKFKNYTRCISHKHNS